MIAAPLNLEARLRKPPRSFDVLFYVNLGALVLMFVLFGSRFVTLPGVQVVLPRTPKPNRTEYAQGLPVWIQRDGQIFFEGGFHTLESFRVRLEQIARERGRESLIVQADQQVPYQNVFALSAAAMDLGVQVTWAAENVRSEGAVDAPAGPAAP